jgi:cyanate lyase
MTLLCRRNEMNREEATTKILEAKKEKDLTFEAIAQKVDRHKVWTTSALLGQQPMSAEEADAVVDLLDLSPEVGEALQEYPMRGSLDTDVPTDPTIYRLYEIVQTYGTTIKALINKEFGDGIMSGVTFSLDIERVESDQGPNVRIICEGKFLPYAWS